MKAIADCRSALLSSFMGLIFCACGSSSTSGQPSVTPGGATGFSGAGNAGQTNGGAANAGAAGSGQPVAGAAGGGGASAVGGAAGMGGSSGAGMAGAGGTSGGRAPIVYVGSTNGQISIYGLDSASGKLTFVKSVAAGNYPSFLALDPSLAHLYAVNEPDAKVAAFSVNKQTGDLTFLNRVDAGGATTAYVGVDRGGKFVLVANYDGGNVRILPIAADGHLGDPTNTTATGKLAHMFLTDAANHFAFVMNKGSDTISQFVFDPAQGTLKPNTLASVATAPGAGPRHLAFHPNGKFAFSINENDETVTAFSYNAAVGQLTPMQTLSALPKGVSNPAYTGAEVVVAPSGNFVYGSNRGHDSIVTFAVDPGTGKLTFITTTPSGGNVPRSFTLSADGKLMLVANESGTVVSFSVDVTSGALKFLTSATVPQKPQFVGIVVFPN